MSPPTDRAYHRKRDLLRKVRKELDLERHPLEFCDLLLYRVKYNKPGDARGLYVSYWGYDMETSPIIHGPEGELP